MAALSTSRLPTRLAWTLLVSGLALALVVTLVQRWNLVTPAAPCGLTVYVSTHTGSDRWSCEQATCRQTPLRTLAAAMRCAPVAENIMLRGGVYTE